MNVRCANKVFLLQPEGGQVNNEMVHKYSDRIKFGFDRD